MKDRENIGDVSKPTQRKKARIQSFCGRNTFKLLWGTKGDDWKTQANLTDAGDRVSSGRDREG